MRFPPSEQPRRGSLRNRIIAWSFFPAAAILSLVAVATYFAYQQVTQDLLVERDQELARLRAGELATSLGEYPELLTAVARERAIAQPDPAQQQAGLAAARNRLIAFDGGLYILNNLGRVTAMEPAQPASFGQDWSNRPYFRPLIGGLGEPAFSDIEPDGPDGAAVIAIAVPILTADNEFLGALVGMFRLGANAISPFYGTILRLRLERNGDAYLVDGRGRMIYASSPAQIGGDFNLHPVAAVALSGQVGAVRTRSHDDRDVLASYGPVPGTQWRLVIEEDWQQLTRASQSYGQVLLALLVLGVVAPTLVVTMGVRRITGSITDLAAAARQVASGNFGQAVSAPTGDELEELADQFNRMSAELQASYANLEQRVAARTRELSTLLKIARDVTSTLDLERLLGLILDQLQSVMDYTGAAILTVENDHLRFRAYRGRPLPESIWRLRIPVAGGLGEQIITQRRPIIVPDVRADESVQTPGRLRAAVDYMRALVGVPLMVKETPLGLLAVFHHQPGYFTAQHGDLALAVAAQAAVAIENARLFEAVQRRGEQFRVLSQVGQRITSILDAKELMAQTAGLIGEAFGYYHVGIGLVEADRLIYQAGAGELWHQAQVNFVVGGLKVGQEGITGWVAGTGEPLLVPDVTRDPRYVWMEGSATRSELAVPIRAKDRVIGVLDVQSDEPEAFDEGDLVVLQSLANQLAVALENARLYEQGRELAAVEERQKLARELHDSVSQALYGIALGARTARTLLERGATEAATLADPLDYVLQLAEAGLAEMRALIFELRPESLKTEGLVAALTKQTDSLRMRHRLEVRVDFCAEPALPLAAKEALYRIAQEAMHNIAKHARASQVEVTLTDAGDAVQLAIHDDGLGFDPAGEFPGHLGLRSMRERAERLGGELRLDSAPGRGTRLSVRLRVTPAAPSDA